MDSSGGPSESAHFWRLPTARDAELLHATFVTHAYARHVHDRYVFGVITRGCEQFHYRGARHLAGPGDVAILNPDEVHDGSAGIADGWTYRMSYLDPALLAAANAMVSGSERAGTPFFPRVVLKDPDLAARFVAFHRALEGTASALEQESGFLLLLADLIARHASRPCGDLRRGAETRAVARTRARLDADFAETVTLDELAALAGLSPLYLIRVFKRATGLPPHAYQTQRRVQAAIRRLRAGDAPAEVAAACGFADQSHLTRVLKKATGVTPAAFRTGSFKNRRARRG